MRTKIGLKQLNEVKCQGMKLKKNNKKIKHKKKQPQE